MSSDWSRVGPSSRISVLIRRQSREDTDTQGEHRWRWRHRLKWSIYRPRNAKGHWLSPAARILDSQPPGLWKNKLLLFQDTWLTVLYYSTSRKPTHILSWPHWTSFCFRALPTLFPAQKVTHPFPHPTPLPGKLKTWCQCPILGEKPF